MIMSIIPSTFIFLLFLSMQTCNARNYKVVVDEGSSGGQLYFSVKGLKAVTEKVMKLKIDTTPIEARDDIIDKSNGGATIPQKPELMKSKTFSQDMKHKKGLIPGVAKLKSLVSFSWHLPHKNGNGNPGFYSDYSRPRTRPPSHN